MDYNFTARVEEDFDRIAEGQEQWKEMMKNFYAGFGPTVDTVMNARSEHKAGERGTGRRPRNGQTCAREDWKIWTRGTNWYR